MQGAQFLGNGAREQYNPRKSTLKERLRPYQKGMMIFRGLFDTPKKSDPLQELCTASVLSVTPQEFQGRLKARIGNTQATTELLDGEFSNASDTLETTKTDCAKQRSNGTLNIGAY